MQTYNVFYLVSGDGEENQNISDTATLSFDAEDLDALFETLQEGEEDLFIINRKSGKKYKFSLEEIEEIE